MPEENPDDVKTPQNNLPIMIVIEPKIAQALLHKGKLAILLQLIPTERKIIELADLCNLNCGSIKRFLDDLMTLGLYFP